MYGDKAIEGDETILFSVSNLSSATVGSAVVTIIDDESLVLASAAPTGQVSGQMTEANPTVTTAVQPAVRGAARNADNIDE